MARIHESVSRVAAARVRALGAKLLGLPRPGANVGRGVHNVDLTTPPAMGEHKAGWDCFDVPIVPEWDDPPDPAQPLPVPDRWTVDCGNYEAEIPIEDVRPALEKRLSVPERAELGARLLEVLERDPPARPVVAAAKARGPR